MKKIIISVILLIVIAVFAVIFINQRIKIHNLNDKLQQALGKDQGLIETILKIESESNSMSYKELFDLCDKSVTERTNILVELRGLYPEMESQLKDSLISYFNNENELVRSKSQAYRKSMSFSTNLDILKDYSRDYSYSEYTYDIYNSYIRKLKREMTEDAIEMRYNLSTFRNNYNLLLTNEKNLLLLMEKEHLRFLPIYDKYKQSNFKYVNECIDYSKFIQDNYSAY